MLALVNEGAKILEEGIAMRASDIDVTYVYGYGFPVLSRRADVLGGPDGPANRAGEGSGPSTPPDTAMSGPLPR